MELAMTTHNWQKQQEAQARAFQASMEAVVSDIEQATDFAALGPHAEREFDVTFAQHRGSYHWFTMRLKWAVILTLLDTNLPTANKDAIILMPGTLLGGGNPGGARRLKKNIEQLHLVILDFDKGDAPLLELDARMEELGLESAAYATFSNGKSQSTLAWSVTRPDAKSGQAETKATALQTFVRSRLGLGDQDFCDPNDIAPDLVKAFMVEEQGFDATVLGDVSIFDANVISRTTVRLPNGKSGNVETWNIIVAHAPIAKSRLVVPLAEPFVRLPSESEADFQTRWEREVYHPVGRLIGFKYDAACASTERGHYAMTCRLGTEPIPTRWVQGRLLDVHDPKVIDMLKSFKDSDPQSKPSQSSPRAAPRKERSRKEKTHAGGSDWRGFLAADAAAAMLTAVSDKRADQNNPLVAFPCPFVHEHTTSNDPSARQCYAYNARSADTLPTIKCQSDTCRNRPYAEFLDALFDEQTKADPTYRLAAEFERTGVYIPREELEAKLGEINETWAVVRVGNRVRYLHEPGDGDIELYDGKSLGAWFSNWFYFWFTDTGLKMTGEIISAWLKWQYRRQYRGVRFHPEPEGAPEGVYNTYFGFTVEPQAGSWKRLLGHMYRNVCKRNPEYFRFLIAWLAQLVQEPHIKPGTNIVLKGKEGTGKTKVAEWVVALFGRNACVVSESERITGRFNAHLENKLLLVAEEAFWAGDKSAEGKLKDLATGMNMSYERKGLDPYEGRNYTRIMIASNEDWIVPASSGGRRWFALEVGDEREKDYAYFAAIDEEMANGGLAAMLYDLQRTDLPQTVNVRSAPVTPWLVEQRLHSYDNKRRWWRGVLLEGGFRDNESGMFIPLNETECTVVKREDFFASAKAYFAGPRGVDPTPSEVGHFIRKMLGDLPEARPTINGKRCWCTVFPPLDDMRKRWLEATGERISGKAGDASTANSVESDDAALASPASKQELDSSNDFADDAIWASENAVQAAVAKGITDDDLLTRLAERAAASGIASSMPMSPLRH
jgi:hypothetical protein